MFVLLQTPSIPNLKVKFLVTPPLLTLGPPFEATNISVSWLVIPTVLNMFEEINNNNNKCLTTKNDFISEVLAHNLLVVLWSLLRWTCLNQDYFKLTFLHPLGSAQKLPILHRVQAADQSEFGERYIDLVRVSKENQGAVGTLSLTV